uniref:Uncharacterized protein n=1 Tax=Plectus sambesii TaxID=2011161 RepID=A0A914XQX0_9BILA
MLKNNRKVCCWHSLAGGVAAALTTPLDVIKTVLNTQQAPEMDGNNRVLLKGSTSRYYGLRDAVRSVRASRGFGGFFCGLQARIVFQVPATAISWSVYELFKYILSWERGV